MVNENGKLIFTIGHSNQSSQEFLKLLCDNFIQILVDIRSRPDSKFANQFNAAILKTTLTNKKIKYLYLGKELGGKPSNPSMYDKEGHALYNVMAQAPSFLKAIQRLLRGLESYRIAVMCSEEDPTKCHRYLLVGRVMGQKGVRVLHIRSDGRVQTDEQLTMTNVRESTASSQFALFPEQKEESWRSAKSIRSASRNVVQKNSSKLLRKLE